MSLEWAHPYISTVIHFFCWTDYAHFGGIQMWEIIGRFETKATNLNWLRKCHLNAEEFWVVNKVYILAVKLRFEIVQDVKVSVVGPTIWLMG